MTHVITNSEHLQSTVDAALAGLNAELVTLTTKMRAARLPGAIANAHLNLDPTWFQKTFLGTKFPTEDAINTWAHKYLDTNNYGPSIMGNWEQYAAYETLKSRQDQIRKDIKDLTALREAAKSVGAETFQVPIRLFNLLGGKT